MNPGNLYSQGRIKLKWGPIGNFLSQKIVLFENLRNFSENGYIFKSSRLFAGPLEVETWAHAINPLLYVTTIKTKYNFLGNAFLL